jgi:hypothetical protein
MRRKLMWIAIGVGALAAVVAAVVLMPGPPPTIAETREALLSSPQQVVIDLAIDIPANSESDNPDHQEIDAEGVIDLTSGEGDFTYDFNELNNAGGFLGHFDEMQILYSDGSSYLDVFERGRAWVRVAPEEVGRDELARLGDIMLTSPVMIPAYLEAEGTEQETSDGRTFTVSPGALTATGDPVTATVGAYLGERGVDAIEVEVTTSDDGRERIVVTFSYDTHKDGETQFRVVATYRFAPASGPDLELPADDDVREYSDVLG